MGKGIVRHGFKSGVLPAARKLFKKPLSPVKLDPAVPQGYAPNILHPRGSTREPVIPEPITSKDIISKSAKSPLKAYSDHELLKMSNDHSAKFIRSQTRRSFLIEALTKEEQKIKDEEEAAVKSKESEKERAELLSKKNYESASTKLTLPSVESELMGKIMRHRTPEETKALKLKREANRLTQELKAKEIKAAKLLDLYFSCKDFIVDETHLESAVQAAFEDNGQYFRNVANGVWQLLRSGDSEQKVAAIESRINSMFLDSPDNEAPSIYEIEDTLTGEIDRLEAQAEEKEQSNIIHGSGPLNIQDNLEKNV